MALLRILVVVAAVVASIMVLDWTKPETKAELRPLPISRVAMTEVLKQDLLSRRVLTGKIQPAKRASLRFEISGQVASRNIEPGQQVKQGELLLTINDGDYQDRFQEAMAEKELEQANISRDRQQLDIINKEIVIQQREVNRLEQLGQKSLASKSNYDKALTNLWQLKSEKSRLNSSVKAANSKLALRETKVNMAKRNIDRTELRAPFDATINTVMYEVGDYARSGEIALELVQLTEMDLYLEVTGKTMSRLSVGQEIEIIFDEEKRTANILSIEPDPNPNTMTHAILIRMSGKGLYSGQLAKAVLPTEQFKNVSVVPLSAILYDEGETYLFLIDDEQKLQRVAVTLLARHENFQAVSGIEPGSKIVASDVAALSEGQEVTIQ